MITVDESITVQEETKEGFAHPTSLNSSVDNKLNSASEKSDSEPSQILIPAHEEQKNMLGDEMTQATVDDSEQSE